MRTRLLRKVAFSSVRITYGKYDWFWRLSDIKFQAKLIHYRGLQVLLFIMFTAVYELSDTRLSVARAESVLLLQLFFLLVAFCSYAHDHLVSWIV